MDENKLEKIFPSKVITVPKYQALYDSMLDFIMNRLGSGKHSILLKGSQGVGKTIMSANLARGINYPFTKFIDSNMFLGYSDIKKQEELVQIFKDAEKTKESLILINDIFRLIDYISFGNRFNNQTFNLLINLIKSCQLSNKKQIILVTADSKLCSLFKLHKYFNQVFEIEDLKSADEIQEVLETLGVESDQGKLISRRVKSTTINALVQNSMMCRGMKAEEWVSNYDKRNSFDSMEEEFDPETA